MQTTLALLLVTLAALFLLRQAWRTLRKDSSAPGCGGGCGCAKTKLTKQR